MTHENVIESIFQADILDERDHNGILSLMDENSSPTKNLRERNMSMRYNKKTFNFDDEDVVSKDN